MGRRLNSARLRLISAANAAAAAQVAVKWSPDETIPTIPVRLLFNSPELNLRAQYSAFDRSTGRPECVGDGLTARRNSDQGIEEVPCTSPGGCEFGREWGCKLFGCLNVQIDGQDDELGNDGARGLLQRGRRRVYRVIYGCRRMPERDDGVRAEIDGRHFDG
mgnify:CR=1 FL=1